MKTKKEKMSEFVSHWTDEIRDAQEYRKRFSTEGDWKDYREYYRGNWAKEIMPINRIFSFGKTMIPNTYFKSPRVSITPTKPGMRVHARVVEAIDNHLIRETNLKRTIKKAILIAYITGTGAIKLGYDSEFGYLPSQAIDVDTSTATQVSTKEQRLIEYNQGVKPGTPWALPVQTEDLIVPYGYDTLNALPWIGTRVLRPLDDIMQDQKYKVEKPLNGTRLQDIKRPPSTVLSGDYDKKFCELYELRDLRTKEIIVLCEEQCILREDDVLQIEGLPYEVIIFNEDPEHFWGISDVKILEPQQLEMNDVRTQISQHRKIALLKFLYLKGAIKKDQLENFLSGKVGPAIEIDGESLNQALSVLQPHVPPDLYNELRQLEGEMTRSLGSSENQEGAFSPYHGKTATESMIVSQADQIRMAERRDVVGDVLLGIIRKWNQYVFSFWTGERVVEVAGPEGGMYWVQYSTEQLRGEYNLQIDIDSGIPITKTLKTQMADGLLALYRNDPLIDQIALRQTHLNEYDYFAPGITGLILQVDPLEAQATALMTKEGGQPPAKDKAEGNRGGGRRGSTPDKPMEFEEFRRKFQENK